MTNSEKLDQERNNLLKHDFSLISDVYTENTITEVWIHGEHQVTIVQELNHTTNTIKNLTITRI